MVTDLHIARLGWQRQDIARFARVASRIYRSDPLWVAPLSAETQAVLGAGNPFFQHSEIAFWVAVRQGRDVGRVAGVIDQMHWRHLGERAAYFGFFEAVQDPEVAHALFEAVSEWARQKAASRLLGPMNPSANNECGLLVDGFDSAPAILMTYNPPYYEGLIRAAGFAKLRDLLAFRIDLAGCPIDRIRRVAARLQEREPAIQFRPVLPKSLPQELPRIKEIYNQAWRKNWGFVPMTDAEVDFMARRLKPLLRAGLVWVADTKEEPAGFLLALPDFNEALLLLRGCPFSSKLFKFLAYLIGWKNPRQARVVALGVKRKFRGRGIETAMLARALDAGFRMGFQAAEASWVLEENIPTCRTIEGLGGRVYKRYRLYERNL